MKGYILLHTLKDEEFICNLSKVVYIGPGKTGSVIYFDEFSEYTVKESLTEILKLLSEKNLD